MEDFLFTPIVILVGVLIHTFILRRHPAGDARTLTIAFVAHVVSAFVQVWLVLYYFPGGGDMLGYYAGGLPVAEALRLDFARFFPELVAAFFQQEYFLPTVLFGGGSTLSMSASAAFLLFLTGDSLFASCVLVAVGSYVSSVLVYHALRPSFPQEQLRWLMAGVLLIPSGVFWSSALLKEPIIMVAVGPLMLGLQWFSAGRRRIPAVVLVVASGTVLAMLKPYVLMALSLAAGMYYLVRRWQSRGAAQLKPFAIVTAAAIAGGGLVAGSRYLAKGDAESAAAAVASQRRVGYQVEGGSNYELDAPPPGGEDIQKRSLAAELALAPLALITAFFRPFLFEARNAVQLANSLEATALLWLFIQAWRRRGWGGILRAVRTSPGMMFCAVFTLALALGTGLASSNLGTLSRYRAPMMPFFFAMLLVLRYAPMAATSLRPVAAARSPRPLAPIPRAGARAPGS